MRACPKRVLTEQKPQLGGGAGADKGRGLKKPV